MFKKATPILSFRVFKKEYKGDTFKDLFVIINPMGKKVCRICLESTGQFLSPCKCKGSQKYVHSTCLHTWRTYSDKNEFKCNTCNSDYIGIPSLPQSRKRTCRCVLLKLINGFVLISAICFFVSLMVSNVAIYGLFFTICDSNGKCSGNILNLELLEAKLILAASGYLLNGWIFRWTTQATDNGIDSARDWVTDHFR